MTQLSTKENSASKVQPQENKMGTLPVPKLVFSMSFPIMISMLVQALYNIVDSIFVAQLSENALTAVSLAFPIQSLMIAISTGTGVGINALLSRNLGEKKFKEANLAATNGIFLAIISFLVMAVIGGTGSHLFYTFQTKNLEIVTAGTQYLMIVTVCSFGLFMQITMERLLQSTGKTIYSMITQAIGAIINIILDPIMIFGLFGFPKLGVAGAAVATVTGQIIAAILCILFNVKKNKELNLNMKGFRPNGHVIGIIYKVGIPSIIMQAISSVMTFGMNKILLGFNSTAAAVLGVYFKLQSFIFMPVFGLTNGIIPIIAYNYGAQKRKRILSTIKLSIITSLAIMFVGFGIFQLFSKELLGLFDASEYMIEIGVPALQIISYSFIFAGYAIICSSVFQAMGNGVYSLIVSVARQLVVILPVAYFFAKFFGLTHVWYSFPIAEIICMILSTILFIRMKKLRIDSLRKSENSIQ